MQMTNRLKSLLVVNSALACAITLAACSAPEGNIANGKRWYAMNNCSACHGPNGNDGKATPIANINMTFGNFVKKLRTTDAPIMPPFPESKVSQQDAADIYAFLKNLKK
jgi:mono/diheme cytochrome c family protein